MAININNHPAHLMLVHFPAALLPMDLCCNILALVIREHNLLYAGFYAAVGGVLIGWLAIITGITDMLAMKRRDKRDESFMIGNGLIHGVLQTMVMVIYTVLVFSACQDYPHLQVNKQSVIVIKVVLIILLFAGNYFGGELMIKNWLLLRDKDRNHATK